MCGIVGISAESNVAGEIYDSLLMLQHRGQDAAGMVVCDAEGNQFPLALSGCRASVTGIGLRCRRDSHRGLVPSLRHCLVLRATGFCQRDRCCGRLFGFC